MLSERRPPTANSRVSAFLDSQRGFMSYYAADGKSVAATWPKPSSGDSRPDSPMLAPRTAAAKDNGLRTMANSVSPDKPVPTFPIDEDESSISESQKPRPGNSSKFTRVVPIESSTAKRKSIDPDQCSDDEPERLQRLEQRRKRRQARRYAIGVGEDATHRGNKPSEVDHSPKTNKRQKSQPEDKVDKKKGKAEVAPALLLMQNFSSQSLGRSRLTIRPSPTVGVFNKGKNSGKITKRGERARKLVPDIVFSESRFLNKTPSVRCSDEDTEDDTDSLDNHSAHSLTERARRQKNRAIKSSERPSYEVIIDQASRSGSPAHSSRSIREESPAWDIEATVPSSPSSVKSADNVYSASPAAPKGATISTMRSVWASKIRYPEQCTPAMPKNASSTLGSPLPRTSPNQPRTTSAYFAPRDIPREHRAPATPLAELNGRTDKEQYQRVVSGLTATLNPVNPPSTPECLQSEPIRFFSAPQNTYMRVPEEHLPSRGGFSTQPLSSTTSLVDGDIQYELECQMERDFGRGARKYITTEDTRYLACTNEHVWDDPDILGWGGYPHPDNLFAIEAGSHEVHSNLDYDDAVFDDGTEHSDDEVERWNEDAEYLYEDTECLDENMEAHPLHRDGVDFKYDNFGELGDYDSCMGAAQEQEPYYPVEWLTIDHPAVERSDRAQINSELDDTLDQEEITEATDQSVERTPRLLRIITEASLQNDLIRSTSGHWGAAHRLY